MRPPATCSTSSRIPAPSPVTAPGPFPRVASSRKASRRRANTVRSSGASPRPASSSASGIRSALMSWRSKTAARKPSKNSAPTTAWWWSARSMPDTPATPKPWLILQALETALQQITVANGYRTDIGQTVSLEKVQNPADVTEAITLYSSALTRQDEANNHNTRIKTREFEFIIEAAVPVAMDSGIVPAHRRMHDIIEDIEQSLDAGVPSTPGAI